MPLPVSFLGPWLCLPSVGRGWPGPCVSPPGFRSPAFTGVGPCGRRSPLSGVARQGWGQRGLPAGSRPAGGVLGQAAVLRLGVCCSLLLQPRRGVGCCGRGVGGHGDTPASCVKLLCAARGGVSQPSVCPSCTSKKAISHCVIPTKEGTSSILLLLVSVRSLAVPGSRPRGASLGMNIVFAHHANWSSGPYSCLEVATGPLELPSLSRVPASRPWLAVPRWKVWQTLLARSHLWGLRAFSRFAYSGPPLWRGPRTITCQHACALQHRRSWVAEWIGG